VRDKETRDALVMAIKLLTAVRGRIKNTEQPSWDIAVAALLVLIDQHDGRYVRSTWKGAA
jgi:hypothetical protein